MKTTKISRKKFRRLCARASRVEFGFWTIFSLHFRGRPYLIRWNGAAGAPGLVVGGHTIAAVRDGCMYDVNDLIVGAYVRLRAKKWEHKIVAVVS